MGTGPGIFDILHIIGKNEVIDRINYALKVIPQLKENIDNEQ